MMSSNAAQSLKDTFADNLPAEIEKIRKLRKDYGSKVIQEVQLDQVYGGARGIKSLVWEGSVLDSEEGIRFRGHTIPEVSELLPKAPGGTEPLPEGMVATRHDSILSICQLLIISRSLLPPLDWSDPQ